MSQDGEAQKHRFGQAVRAARVGAGLSQEAAARRGGISVVSWGAVERGRRSPGDRSLAAIERGVGWSSGTATRVWAGGKPPRPPKPPIEPPPADLGQVVERLDRLEQLVAEVLRRLPDGAQ